MECGEAGMGEAEELRRRDANFWLCVLLRWKIKCLFHYALISSKSFRVRCSLWGTACNCAVIICSCKLSTYSIPFVNCPQNLSFCLNCSHDYFYTSCLWNLIFWVGVNYLKFCIFFLMCSYNLGDLIIPRKNKHY